MLNHVHQKSDASRQQNYLKYNQRAEPQWVQVSFQSVSQSFSWHVMPGNFLNTDSFQVPSQAWLRGWETHK